MVTRNKRGTKQMKKILKKVVKLIDFLLRNFSRCLKVGVKVCEEYQRAGDKVGKIASVLTDVAAICQQLEAKKKIIEDLANGE